MKRVALHHSIRKKLANLLYSPQKNKFFLTLYNYQPYYSGATAYVGNTQLTVGDNFTYLTTASTVQDSDVFYLIVGILKNLEFLSY